MIEVKLTESEMRMAAGVGIDRQIQSVVRGLQDKHGYTGNGWDIHILGALTELVVAKHFGLYWEGGVNTFKKPDVAGYQIRYNNTTPNYLIIRPEDDVKETYICVVGKAPTFFIAGWMTGKEAKVKKWFGNPFKNKRPDAFCVPVNELRSIEDIYDKQDTQIGVAQDTKFSGFT